MSPSLDRALPLSVEHHPELFKTISEGILGDETEALELKSEWDLSDKKKMGAIARIILGFANRDPAVAGKYFGGEAYLVLGIDTDRAEGVVKADAARVSMQIQSYLGTRGPQIVLDYGRFTEVDVAVITMLPVPRAAHIYALEKEFPHYSGSKEGLWRNGTIFVRSGTSTEVATAEDIRRLERRLIGGLQKLRPQVDIGWNRNSRVFWLDGSDAEEWLEEHRNHLISRQEPEPPTPSGQFDFAHLMLTSLTPGKQTLSNYKRDLNKYIEQCRAAIPVWMCHVWHSTPGGQSDLKITNITDEAMLSVRLTLQISADVKVVTDDPQPNWPKQPLAVGRDKPSGLYSSLTHPGFKPGWVHHPLRPSVERMPGLVKVVFDLGDIATEETVITWPISLLSRASEVSGTIPVTWAITANNRRGTDKGTLSMAPTERVAVKNVLSETVPQKG